MNTETYFKPLTHLIRCELNEIKRSDALTILSYFSLIVPLVFVGLSCLKGRVKEHSPESSKLKADSVAQEILNPFEDEEIDGPEALYQNGLKEPDAYKALCYFNEASVQGHKEATYQLGICYLKGRGIVENYGIARACFKNAAQNNIPEAYCELGYMARNGLGCDKDLILAAEYYYQAKTKEGSVNFDLIVNSMSHDEKAAFGVKIQRNQSVIKDKKIAFDFFKSGADAGHAPSQSHLGWTYRLGTGVEQNYAEAVKYFTMAAENGFPGAYLHLGALHLEGELGFKKDSAKAIECFNKALELGNIRSYYFLGLAYQEKETLDLVKSREYFEKGVSLNQADCFANLAIMYKQGLGGDKDPIKAFELFKKAADLGVTVANVFLGEMHFTGSGTPANDALSFKHYLIAANQKHPNAQYCLGILYEHGRGIPKDMANALKYYELAAAQGFQLAIDAVKRLKEEQSF